MRKHWFFDFDGTLCDTEADIKAAWRAAIRGLGRECPRFDAVYRTVLAALQGEQLKPEIRLPEAESAAERREEAAPAPAPKPRTPVFSPSAGSFPHSGMRVPAPSTTVKASFPMGTESSFSSLGPSRTRRKPHRTGLGGARAEPSSRM